LGGSEEYRRVVKMIYLTIAWLLVFVQYMIALMILSTPFIKYTKGYAYDLIDGVCLSTILLSFFSSFSFTTSLLKNYLKSDFLSWDLALERIVFVYSGLDFIIFMIALISAGIGIAYIVASFLLTGLTLGVFSLFQADIACRIFQSIMTLTCGIGVLSLLFKLFYIYSAFIYLFAPLIFCIGVMLYPLRETRKFATLLIILTVVGYVAIPFLLGSVPMVKAKGTVENLGNSTSPALYNDPFLYKNTTLSLISKENRSINYAIVFLNSSIIRWINCSERKTLLPEGEYNASIWYLGFIHNIQPEKIKIENNYTLTNSSSNSSIIDSLKYLNEVSEKQFENNTKIIFKLNNVSFVSDNFIVAYDNSFKGNSGKYNASVKLDLNNVESEEKISEKTIYFYYDKNNIIDYSCSIIDPKIEIENYTIEVSHRIEDSSPEELIEKGYVKEYKPKLEFKAEYLDHNETAIISTNIVVKKIILKYHTKPIIKYEEKDGGSDEETFIRSNGKEQYHTFEKYAEEEGWSIKIDKISCSGPAYETHGYKSQGSVARVRVTVHFTTDDPNATATVTVKYKLYKEIKPKNKPPEFANFLIYFETIDRGFNAPDITYQQKDPLLKPLTASAFALNPTIPLISDFIAPLLSEALKVGVAMVITVLVSDIASGYVAKGTVLTPFKNHVKKIMEKSKAIENVKKHIEKKAWKDVLGIQGKAWERKEEEREKAIDKIEKEAEEKYGKKGVYFIEKDGEVIPVSQGEINQQLGFYYDEDRGILIEGEQKNFENKKEEFSEVEKEEDIDLKEKAKNLGLPENEIEEIDKMIDSEYEDEYDSLDNLDEVSKLLGYEIDYDENKRRRMK
jgi:hypothetical protein